MKDENKKKLIEVFTELATSIEDLTVMVENLTRRVAKLEEQLGAEKPKH